MDIKCVFIYSCLFNNAVASSSTYIASKGVNSG